MELIIYIINITHIQSNEWFAQVVVSQRVGWEVLSLIPRFKLKNFKNFATLTSLTFELLGRLGRAALAGRVESVNGLK